MILQHRPVKADDIKTICSFPLNAQELFYMFPKAQYPLTEAQLSNAITQRFDSTRRLSKRGIASSVLLTFIGLKRVEFAVSAMSSLPKRHEVKVWRPSSWRR